MARSVRIPYGAWPRGLAGEDLAAFYVGETPSSFREGVKNGRWPAPQRRGNRDVWDRALLDDAYDRHSGLDAEPGEREALEAIHDHRKAALR